MNKLKCAVIGAGYLGKFHIQKYAAISECDLVAIVDNDFQLAEKLAQEYGATAYSDYKEILDKVDAVSIVVPTTLHHAVARDFLMAKIHVLVEKPITVTLEEADELIALAEQNHCVLQVGHLERFNPAVMGLDKEEKPLFIESHRISPFNPRANDVSVILDLMIHDIDIILALVKSDIKRVDASGTAVLTKGIDIANARLVFDSGCVANVTASRISMKSERKMRLFRPNSYVSVDFQNRVLTKHRTGSKEMFPGVPEIETEESVFESGDALMDEIKHFVTCVISKTLPLVSGTDGKRALAAAIMISDLLT
jgi:predicted dehydrogenase